MVVALREEIGVSARDAFAEVMLRPLGVVPSTWAGGLDGLRQRPGDWDLLGMSSGDGQAACDQGLLEKLDWPTLGGRDRYSALGASDCTVGAFVSAVVLAWDRDKLAVSPSWADFWDVAKFPGKRALSGVARGNLEFALLADGVSPGDVYRVLRGTDGVARAFRKLDQLKPYLVFWSSGAEAARMLASGEVLMTSGPAASFVLASREGRHFAMQWAGNLGAVEVWGIPKGSAEVAAAGRLLAALGDAKLQARLPAAAGLGGLARGANDGLTPEQQAQSPSLPTNLDRGLLIDDVFWRDNRDKLGQQFEAWLAR